MKVFSKTAGLVVLAAVFVYAAVYVDVVLRARTAFLEGEKYMQWNLDPAKKTAYFENQYQHEITKLESAKLSSDDHDQKMAALKFERDFNINESSLKYAYQYYKDTYELFSPPESKWVKDARKKAPEALVLWKDELRAKKIPFEDYMFE